FLVADSFEITDDFQYCDDLLTINATKDEIEDSFDRLAVLHLYGIFPLWSSAAYHNLVDLRLLSTDEWSRIREAELVAILKASPGLRILHFELIIIDPTPPAEGVTVVLPDLQVVNVAAFGGVMQLYPSDLLRLLSPGTKPLRLSLEGYNIQEKSVLTQVESFFARSRVVNLYIQSVLPPLNLLLRHSVDLDHVVINRIETGTHAEYNPEWLKVDRFASLPRLKSLYVTRSTMLEHEFRSLLECCPDGTVLSNCRIGRRDMSRCFAESDILAISQAFPAVKLTDHALYPEEGPTADWDILD
ncbi:unnamed protein product, partial [Rhizoctonia solani]